MNTQKHRAVSSRSARPCLVCLSVLAGYGALLLIGHRLRAVGSPWGVAVIGALLVWNVLYSVLYFVNEFRHDRVVSGEMALAQASTIQKRRRYLTWYWVIVANLSQLFVFAFLFEYVYEVLDGQYFSFERRITYFDWLLYTVDCTFKSLFDVTEIFDLHLRNIRHQGLVGGAIVFSVRLLIYTLLVAALARQWNRWRMVRETVTALDNAPELAGRRLIRMGEEALPHLQRALGRSRSFASAHENERITRDEHSRPLIELLLRNLTVGNENERRNAAVALGLLAPKDPSRRPYFSALAHVAESDPIAEIRVESIRALGQIDDPRALAPLRKLLGDREPDVRAQAARVLGHRADHRSIGQLESLLHDSVSTVRVAAVRALGRIGRHGALPSLRNALDHSDAAVSEEAVHSLSHLRDPEVGPRLLGLLRSEDPKVRRKAIESVDTLRPSGAAEALEPLLEDSDPEVRSLATTVLGRIDLHRACEAILSRPRDRDPVVRRAQLLVVSDRRSESGVPFLEDAVQDEDPVVRERAIDALSALGSSRARYALLRAVASGDREDRLHAVRALGEAHATEAYDSLLRIARGDSDRHLRRQALRALLSIDRRKASLDARQLLEDPAVCSEAAMVLLHAGSV